MTIERFQAVVLRLGNQCFVRHYLWLSYPNDPQIMGIEFVNQAKRGDSRLNTTCECGTCRKCLHRKCVQEHRPISRLHAEMTEAGFTLDPVTGIWTVARTEE